MFDYLLSKMVWIIAAVILTASVISIFTWQNRSLQEIKLEEQVENISGLIDEVSRTDAEFNVTISFEDEYSEYYIDLPSQCTLNFTKNYIYSEHQDTKNSKRIYKDIYLFDPLFLNDSVSDNTLNMIQKRIDFFEANDKDAIVLKSKKLNQDYKTFVYPLKENKGGGIEKIREFGKYLNDFYSWNMTTIDEGNINKTEEFVLHRKLIISNEFLLQDNSSRVTPYPINTVHLWEPIDYKINPKIIENKDEKNTGLTVDKYAILNLERRIIDVNGNKTIMNFIYI